MKYANFKRMTAMVMAAAMVCSPVAAMAADVTEPGNASGSVSGSGKLEDYVDKDAFRVVLPTVSDVNFTLDPQGLLTIADTANSKSDYSLGKGAIYFGNKTNTSDAMIVLNKSSYPVDVEFAVNVALPEGVSLVGKDALASATTPSVYLAMYEATETSSTVQTLVEGDNLYGVAKTATAVAETTTPTTTPGYYVKAEEDSTAPNGYKYSYALTDTFTDTDVAATGKFSFYLTGECDKTADWSAIDALESNNTVTATVTWSVTKHVDAPSSVEATETEIDSTGGDVSVKYPTGKSFLKVQYTTDGTNYTDLEATYYTTTDIKFGKKITFGDITALNATKVKIVSADGSEDVEIDVNAITPPVVDEAPSIATTTYTVTTGQPVTVELDYGTGSKAATNVAKILNSANAEVPTARYSVSGSTLTIDGTFTRNNASGIKSATGLKLKVVFNDGDSTPVEITLK